VVLIGVPALADDPPGPESAAMSVTINVVAGPLELRIIPTNTVAESDFVTDSTDIVWEFFPNQDTGGFAGSLIEWDVDVRTGYSETTQVVLESPGLDDPEVLEDLYVEVGMYQKNDADPDDMAAFRGTVTGPGTPGCASFLDFGSYVDAGPRDKRVCFGLFPGFDSITGANGTVAQIQHYLIGRAPSTVGSIRIDYAFVISVESSNGD
jgi:hypothetical protein